MVSFFFIIKWPDKLVNNVTIFANTKIIFFFFMRVNHLFCLFTFHIVFFFRIIYLLLEHVTM